MKIIPVEVAFSPCQQMDGRADGRPDRHGEANSRCSQICGRAYKLSLRSLLVSTVPTVRAFSHNTGNTPFITQFICVSFYPKVSINYVSKDH